MRKHLLLIFQHRAGVRPYTSFYNLAESCVFIKQSQPPILCHLYYFILYKSYSNYIYIIKVLFLPKLQSHFAEFLQHNYLIHLSLLNLSTCVGLGYGFYLYISILHEILLRFIKNFLIFKNIMSTC